MLSLTILWAPWTYLGSSVPCDVCRGCSDLETQLCWYVKMEAVPRRLLIPSKDHFTYLGSSQHASSVPRVRKVQLIVILFKPSFWNPRTSFLHILWLKSVTGPSQSKGWKWLGKVGRLGSTFWCKQRYVHKRREEIVKGHLQWQATDYM